jgi:hypothetical protein
MEQKRACHPQKAGNPGLVAPIEGYSLEKSLVAPYTEADRPVLNVLILLSHPHDVRFSCNRSYDKSF